LDDCLGGLFPQDLVLIGAATGVGKTAIATQAAQAGLNKGRRVYLFALEAEVGEVGARLYFTELGLRSKDTKLDYSGWLRGEYKHLDAQHHAAIIKTLTPNLERLHVLYKKRGDFTNRNLSQQLEAIAGQAEMIVLDHIHVIDTNGGEFTNDTQTKTIRLLRDCAFSGSVPVVVCSHLRKHQTGERTIMPDIDDLHGTSNLAKLAKQVILISRDWESPWPTNTKVPTFMSIRKDRRGRGSHQIAKMHYNVNTGLYDTTYELGRAVWKDRKHQWEVLPQEQIPHWATHEERVIPF
jgi:replicative DNA helicase